jgi:hypothetical protein
MDQKEKRQLENQLLAEGLAKLDSPELIEQMANLVNNWPGDRHEFLMGLINECDDKDRSEMYNFIRPHLKFKPLPLDTYVAHIAERAGAMVSQNRMRVEGSRPRPIQIGRDTFVPVPKEIATGAVATVKCHRCNKGEKFHAATPVGAMLKARQAGWIREPGINKECCAECTALLAHSEQVMLSRTEVMIVTDKRRVN